jgi:hypothetical protein
MSKLPEPVTCPTCDGQYTPAHVSWCFTDQALKAIGLKGRDCPFCLANALSDIAGDVWIALTTGSLCRATALAGVAGSGGPGLSAEEWGVTRDAEAAAFDSVMDGGTDPDDCTREDLAAAEDFLRKRRAARKAHDECLVIHHGCDDPAGDLDL